MRTKEPLRAKDLMHQDVAYVHADMNLVNLAAFLDDNKIHGAPVVGAQDRLIGVVSRTDLARAVTEGDHSDAHLAYFRSLDDEGQVIEMMTDVDNGAYPGANVTVGEIMSTKIVTVDPDCTAAKVAEEMSATGVHRVLVVTDQQVRGIISVTDLLQVISTYESQLTG